MQEQKVNAKFSKDRLAFFSALLSGLAAHFMVYASSLSVLDGLWNGVWHISAEWELSLGRWGLRLVDLARGGLVSRPLIALLALLFLSLAAVLLCRLLCPQSRLCIVLASAALTVSPQVAAMMTDLYCADGYALAVLLAVGCMALVFGFDDHGRRGLCRLAAAALCLALSLSLYQCYIGVAALLALFLLYRLLVDGAPLAQVGRKAVEALGVGVGGSVLYYGITLLWLRIWGLSFAAYGGADSFSVGKILTSLPSSLRYSLHYLSEYFLFDSIVHNTIWRRQLLWLALFALFALSQLLLWRRRGWLRQPARLAAMLLCFALMPPAISLMYIISPEYHTNLLMSQPVVLVLPCVLCLVRPCPAAQAPVKKQLLGLLAAGCCALILWTQLWQTNATYMAIENNVNQTRAIAQDVYQRAVQLEGYEAGLPYLFAGSVNALAEQRGLEPVYARSSGLFTSGTHFEETQGNAADWEHFFQAYLGQSVVVCDEEYYADLLGGEEFLRMPLYPAPGSVRLLEGKIVVRFE